MTDDASPTPEPERQWLARPGQAPIGPFAWPEVVATLRRAGGVGDWMACPEGGGAWTPLASDPAIVAAVNPPPMPPPPRSPQGFPPPTGTYAAPAAVPNAGVLVLIHISGVIDCLCWPVGLILALVLWLSNRDKPDIDAHGKEVMNWKIFTAIVCVAALPLACVYIGLLVLFAVWVAWLVYGILGAVKASNGELIRYPMFFRLIK